MFGFWVLAYLLFGPNSNIVLILIGIPILRSVSLVKLFFYVLPLQTAFMMKLELIFVNLFDKTVSHKRKLDKKKRKEK